MGVDGTPKGQRISMQQGHMRRGDLVSYNVRLAFQKGDWVLMRLPGPSKLEVGSRGPFCFVQYTQGLGVTTLIEDSKERRLEVSIANLLPIAAGTWLQL